MKDILGPLGANTFAAACFFCLLGWILYKVITFQKATKKTKFSWSYWIKDNVIEAAYKVAWTFVLVRFGPELWQAVSPDTFKQYASSGGSMTTYFLLGIFASFIINKIKKSVPKE